MRFERSGLESHCSEAGNLGLIFDKCMSWDSHVSRVSRRCMGTLVGLSHVRHHLPECVLTTLATALVVSQIRYCLSVYVNSTKKNMDRLQKILNFGARVTYGRRKFDHVSDLLDKLGWLRSQQMADVCTVCCKSIAHGVWPAGPNSLRATGPVTQLRVIRQRRGSDELF